MKKNKLYYFIIFISFNLFLLPAKSDPMFDLGKDVFLNKAVCSTCHTLVDAGSYGQIGPNLNEIKPDKMRVMNSKSVIFYIFLFEVFNFFKTLGIFLTISSAIKPGPNFLAISP